MVTTTVALDKRVKKISDILTEYSKGNFSKKVTPSKKFDEIDAIMFSLNMLGEEMYTTTISKNHFNQIYNSVKEMIFELDKNGTIINYNNIINTKLEYKPGELLGKNIYQVLKNINAFDKPLAKLSLKTLSKQASFYFKLQPKIKKELFCLCQVIPFSDKNNSKIKFILTAKNISAEKQIEQNAMAEVIRLQEFERTRLAKELHDGIGQQLSAIKLYLGSISNLNKDAAYRNILDNCSSLVGNINQEIRGICFDLMPRTLADAGLILATQELARQINVTNTTTIKITVLNNQLKFTKEQELALYRVIQEFINNSIKHSKCRVIKIEFTKKTKRLYIKLADNGIGFDLNSEKIKKKGLGIFSMNNRISAINGDMQLTSQTNKGTQLQILL
jgi:PAS domain S-box-containing protein